MERGDRVPYRDFDFPPENAVQTALQTERVLHLRGFRYHNVEVLYRPAQGFDA